jgi:DNA topoisomerase III
VGKRLVITEKPSVARDIAQALGGFDATEDYLESRDLVVTWAVGHLLKLADPAVYNKEWGRWTVTNLPMIPETFQLEPREGHKARLKLIQKLGRRPDVDGLINACDAGREGELIFRRIVEYTGLDDRPTERLWLQSMTRDAIHEAFNSLKPGSDLDPLGDAAWLRSVGDWLVGINATRAVTKRLSGKADKDSWSVGRVQTPTLNLLVQQERAILAHVPRPYWELEASFQRDGHAWTGRWYDPERSNDDPEAKPTRIFDEATASAILNGVRAARSGVASERRRRAQRRPPLPFDLTSLQREANGRFSFSAKRTLDAAQRLYEGHKLITYPRTDSRYLPGDYGETVLEVLRALESDVDFAGLANGILEAGPLNLERILDGSKVSDHFAIVPTGAESERSLSPDDARIYELIVRQFLASLMGPATEAKVERIVTVDLPAGPARFRTLETTVEIPGFLAALKPSDPAAAAAPRLPPLVPGQDTVEGVEARVDSVELEGKMTRPPSRMTEARLLGAMETAGQLIDDDDLSEAMRGKGLGTPATRAETIENLIRKQYARRIRGQIAPTPKGMRLVDVMDRLRVDALLSPGLTGEWEYKLGQVERGELSRGRVFDEIRDLTREVTTSVVGFEHDEIYRDDPSLGACPVCADGRVVENAWGYPCSHNVDKDSSCRFMIWKDRAGRYVDRKLVAELLERRTVGPVGGFFDKAGRESTATLHLEPDEEKGRWTIRLDFAPRAATDEEPERELGRFCPDPDAPERWIVETTHRYVSERVLAKEVKRGPQLPKVVCHREIASEEALPYFGADGSTPLLEDFVSRHGRPFKAMLVRKPTGGHGFEFPPREGAAPAADGASAKKPRAAAKPKAGAEPKAKAGAAAKASKAKAGAAPKSDAEPKSAKAKAGAAPKSVKAKAGTAPKARKVPNSAEAGAESQSPKAEPAAKSTPAAKRSAGPQSSKKAVIGPDAPEADGSNA